MEDYGSKLETVDMKIEKKEIVSKEIWEYCLTQTDYTVYRKYRGYFRKEEHDHFIWPTFLKFTNNDNVKEVIINDYIFDGFSFPPSFIKGFFSLKIMENYATMLTLSDDGKKLIKSRYRLSKVSSG